MFKHKVTTFILLMAVLIYGKAYGQQEIKGMSISTISGQVVSLDTASQVLTVKTDNGTMDFYVSIESDLFLGTHHIASIEITPKDPVTIQYATTASGKNVIIKLVDTNPDNGM